SPEKSHEKNVVERIAGGNNSKPNPFAPQRRGNVEHRCLLRDRRLRTGKTRRFIVSMYGLGDCERKELRYLIWQTRNRRSYGRHILIGIPEPRNAAWKNDIQPVGTLVRIRSGRMSLIRG